MKIPEPTIAEVFEEVEAYFSQADSFAIGPFGECVYRTEDGRACAVGCLIPNEAYDVEWDDDSVSAVRICADLGWKDVELRNLLIDLQSKHDSVARRELPMSEFLDRVRELKIQYLEGAG